MRIWSLHPSLLDQKGLVACWRETLLAQKVLRGLTDGYRNHPQLERFRAHPQPIAAIGAYLSGIADEADSRGHRFNRGLIAQPPAGPDDGPSPSVGTSSRARRGEGEESTASVRASSGSPRMRDQARATI